MGSVFLPDEQSNLSNFLLQQPKDSTDAEYQRILKLINDANPKVQNPLQCTIPDEPILVPSSGHFLEAPEKSHFEYFRNSYRTASNDGKQLLKELSQDCQQFYELLAISEWTSETFGDYSSLSGAADFNTGLGGIGTMINTRGQEILNQLSKIDELIVRYASSSTSQKATLKQEIKKAYADLHGRFGNDINKMIGKVKPNSKQSPLINPNNAMKIAAGKSSGARSIPLTGAKETRNLMRLLNKSRIVGRGIVAIDLGFRINNVRVAPTLESKIRTATVEATGFVVSSYAALYAGQALASVILVNPIVGVVLLLAVGVTAAILGDYAGKYAASNVWDTANSYGQILAR